MRILEFCGQDTACVIGMHVCRVKLVKRSDVPERAYNSRSSEFGGFFY